MKKITLILPFLLLLIVGCDEDATSPDDACVELTTAFSNAATEYESDMTLANCEAQYTALVAWCDGDCEPSDTATEDSMCTDMTGLDAATITAACELLMADEDDSDEDGADEDGADEDGDDEDVSDEDGDAEDGDGSDDMPECLLDCGDLGNIAGDPVDVGQDVYCNELTAFDDSCLSDCDDETMAFFDMMLIQCEACLENDNCECYFVDESPEGCEDDDDEDGDESDDGDDDFPECFLDCDMSMLNSPTATCEFFGGDDISCTDDCTGDDAVMVALWPIMCGTCVEDGDCDDVLGDDDDDEEDGDDEDGDGPPDCYLDCPDVEPLSDFMDNGIGDMTSDEVCEIFVSWDADTCLDDCSSEDLEFLDEVVPLCSACLDAGNCDDLFGDDGE